MLLPRKASLVVLVLLLKTLVPEVLAREVDKGVETAWMRAEVSVKGDDVAVTISAEGPESEEELLAYCAYEMLVSYEVVVGEPPSTGETDELDMLVVNVIALSVSDDVGPAEGLLVVVWAGAAELAAPSPA